VVALRAVALALKGFLVLWVLHLGLALIGSVVLIAWGVALIVTAHPVHPVRILGVVNDAAEIYEGQTYVRTELSLSGDGRLFMMNGPAMQPPMSLSHPAPGDLVALWVDPDLSWVDISKTEIYAVSLGHEGLAQPAHKDSDLKDPAAMADRQRLVGAGILSLAALIFGLGYVGTNFAAGSQGNVRRRHSQEGAGESRTGLGPRLCRRIGQPVGGTILGISPPSRRFC
jgi:hypothetical protein